MCDKIVNTHSSTIEFVPECFKTQKMCDKAFNKCFLVFFIFLIDIKNQEMCDRTISDDLFSIKYVLDQYKTQQIFDKAADDYLAV